ncbi:major facilitator superfamily transporter [Thozetella sp. PMI_491]|nr:major facilitator superfamily transporter [Thozetella sp. PMI_491]
MPSTEPLHPRDSLAPWKFKAMLPLISLLAMTYGYDVSNAANTQSSIYEAMGHVELLPWVGLAFTMGSCAATPLYNRLSYIFNLQYLTTVSLVIFVAGATMAAAGNNMATIIAGRVIAGIGQSGVYQLTLAYVSAFARPHESPRVIGMIGMSWGIGLILGPIIGGSFAQNPHATWRWSMYINLPVAAVLLVGNFLIYPPYTAPRSETVRDSLFAIDFVGFVLHVAQITLLILALTSSGTLWAWNSGSTIAIWVIWILVLVSYFAQQRFSLFTSPMNRIFPFHLLTHRPLGLVALATCASGSAYSITLYYLPLFFAFARGYGPIDTAVHLFPFICVFVVTALLAGGLLRVVRRYAAFYVLAGVLFLVGGMLISTIDAETSESRVMGYEAIMGFGLGLAWLQGVAISNAVLPAHERFHGVALVNMAQVASIPISLGIAGCIFQNQGFAELQDALRPFGLDETKVREALAGVASPLWTEGDPRVVDIAVAVITKEMAKLFYLVGASGALCLVAGVLMGWAKLDVQNPSEQASPKSNAEVSSG